MATGLKTATEVISENSKTYKTIRNYQTQLKPAIEHVCENIIQLGALYDMEFEGRKVAELARDYEISVMMEDSVLEDSQTKLDRAILLLSNGLISKKTAMTDPKYGLGMTEEEADAEIEAIAAEKTVDATAFDVFQAGTLE
jgi:A118 family predicted phage portal protein